VHVRIANRMEAGSFLVRSEQFAQRLPVFSAVWHLLR